MQLICEAQLKISIYIKSPSPLNVMYTQCLCCSELVSSLLIALIVNHFGEKRQQNEKDVK